MKKKILAALAILALASCAKESATSETPTVDPSATVAATFSSAAITRVAGEEWVTGDQIGITMVGHDSNTPIAIDGTDPTEYYSNIPYTVDDTDLTAGKFTADDTVIYFPTDDSVPVDFIAYYPYTADSSVDADKNITISVANQEAEHIDLVAAKATNKTKSYPTVTFTDNEATGGSNEAFSHQLSKLSLTISEGDGVSNLAGLQTTIKGQYTEATFNIYTFALTSDETSEADITAITNADGDTVTAILLPTDAIDGSSIVFSVDGVDYTWDTSSLKLEQGNEYKFKIALTRTGVVLSDATIEGWNVIEESDTIEASDL